MIEARFKGRVGDFALDVAFDGVAAGVTGLFGPSGCGKTTVLRCLAGLTRLAEGYLAVDGEIWQDGARFLPAHRRPVGTVFQEPRLFAHLSVRGNLRFGLRRAPLPIVVGFESVVELLGLGGLLERMPAALSGGEKQRVAIGRALLSQPRLLLMDEPLSALDRGAKDEILPYLEALPAALAMPIIYVTHDLAEIERLADSVVLIGRDGRVEASGSLTALTTDLALPLAFQPDAAAMLTVRVESYDADYDLTTGLVGDLRFLIPGRLGEEGTRHRIRVRAGDVSLAAAKPCGSSVLNILPASVVAVEAAGANQMLVLLGLGGDGRVLSRVTRKSWDGLGLKPGDPVFAQVKGVALVARH